MIYYNVGRREVGKTTLALYQVRHARYQVLFDPRGLFPAETRVSGSQAIQTAFDRWCDADSAKPCPPIVVTPERNVQGNFETTAREVKRWIQTGDQIAFVVDEVLQVDMSPSDEADEFNWILRLCPRQQAIVVLTGHRPTDIPVNVRAICDYWILFHMTQEHDLNTIRKRMGDRVAAHLPTLRPYEFVVWDDGKADYSINRNSKAWYSPLRASQTNIATIATPKIDGNRETEKKLF